MKNKLIAGIVLSLICLSLLGIVIFFIRSTQLDIISYATLHNQVIPIVMSFSYKEIQEKEETDVDRLLSVLLLLNPTTKRLGLLELPSYTGVYDSPLQIVVPIDYYYRQYGISTYIERLNEILQIPRLQYIYIPYDSLALFIDLIGGVEILLIDDEIGFDNVAITGSKYGTGVGDIYFDGPSMYDYLNTVENSNSDELLKSTKRKEFVLSIISQIQRENNAYKNSKLLLNKMNNYVQTSLNTKELRKTLLLLSDYNLDKVYFQHISGRLQNIDTSTTVSENTLSEHVLQSKILFTSTDVGNLSKIYKSLESKLNQEYSDKIHEQITISILNGTIVNGLAGRTKEIYTSAGFKVLSIGNASRSDIETTTIIDRIGNIVNVNFAAQIIGVKSVITDITSVDEAGADLTLILGKDFDGEQVE